MMRGACLGVWLTVAAVVPSAAQTPPPPARVIEQLIVDARRAPAEFEADVLLRLAQSPALTDRRRLELLNEAFQRAYGAQESYRRISLGVPTDSRQGAQALTYDSRLTRVSLQVRAAQMTAIINPLRAREQFEWIQTGAEATPCEDTLVPALGEYYTTLSMLARTTFPASDRGAALRFLEYYLWRAHLASEMPAVATAITRFNPRTDEAQYLTGFVHNIFEGTTRDPRGFAVSGGDFVAKFGELDDANHERGVTGTYLLGAMRDYVKRQLTGPRCGDSTMEPYALSTLNARIRRALAVGFDGLTELQPADARPSTVLPSARIDMYWQTPDARRLHESFMALRGRDKDPVPERLRVTKEWQEQAEHLILDLEQWSGAREAKTSDYFYQKATLFAELLALIPQGNVRAHAVVAFVDFLRRTDIDREGRTLWFVFASRLLEFAHGGDRTFLLDTIEGTNHPVLSLYAKIERLLSDKRRSN
jgi:hypothetical protein